MPELPEVETIRENLASAGLIGHTFSTPEIYWARSIAVPASDAFAVALKGRRIARFSRRGKWLCIELDRGALWLHLRMSGKLLLGALSNVYLPWRRLSFQLKDRELHLVDPRKFARIYLLDTAEELPTNLGFDLLSLKKMSPKWQGDLCAQLAKSQRSIKAVLLDQSIVAGIGNIYADEALWRAKIHPALTCQKAGPARTFLALSRAYDAVIDAIAEGGTSLGQSRMRYCNAFGKAGNFQMHLRVYGKAEKACTRCRNIIQRCIVAGRSTHFCPFCQRGD